MSLLRNYPSTAAAALFFFVIMLTWLATGMLFRPQDDPDAVYFEVIAANLAERGEFSGALNEEAVRPYLDWGMSEALDPVSGTYAREIRLLGVDGINAYRPPLYPMLLASIYKVFGRSFIWPRLVNLICMSLGIGLLVSAATKIGMPAPAFPIMALAFSDPSALFYSGLATTEAMAYFGVSVFLYLFVRGFEPQNSPLRMGAVLGLLGLVRHVFFLWLPILLATLFKPFAVRQRALFLIAALAVLLPWAVRNSMHLQMIAPLGSQGGIILGMVYNDKTFERGGNWTHESHHEFVEQVAATSAENREKSNMLLGKEQFRSWLTENWIRLPELFIRRVVSLWWSDAMASQRLLVFLSIIALLTFRREHWAHFCFSLCLAHSVAIGLTCNITRRADLVAGRYLFSLHPVLILLSAMLIHRALSQLKFRKAA